MKKNGVCLIGGDKRQYYLAKQLHENGFEIHFFGIKELEGAEFTQDMKTLQEGMAGSRIILLPVPVSVDGDAVKSSADYKRKPILLSEVRKGITEGHIVFGGKIPKQIKKECEEKKAICVDYMQIEEITLKNTIATAEGAVLEALLGSEENLQGSRCLVVGFGRCGEVLADKLFGMKAKVTIMARRGEVRAKAEACGYRAVPMFGENWDNDYDSYDFVFNTVPDMVVKKSVIDSLKEDVFIIDIASNPGGVDFEYCKEIGKKAKHCLSLPGKYAAKASGRILMEAVTAYLEQD